MTYFYIGLGLVAVLIGLWYVRRLLRNKRRAALRLRPVEPAWLPILESHVALYNKLPESLRDRLHGHIHVFLAEKTFYGCEDLEVTLEMRLTIAANACLLLLNQKPHYYPALKSIYIYPSAYEAKITTHTGGIQTEGTSTRLGESWHRGPLVLAWDAARHGAYNPNDGQNVILHEFAHRLDGLDGTIDGAPKLASRSQYKSWATVCLKEYKQLVKMTGKRRKTVMDEYGATEPAEFFAVLIETFFEKPRQLKRKHPELYEEVKGFTGLDPESWR